VFARLHTLATTLEQYELGLKLVRGELLPCGAQEQRLPRPRRSGRPRVGQGARAHALADDDTFEQSAEHGDRLGSLAATASGATRQSLETFEVSLFDVPQRAD
jgi:hypothetical protein